MKIQGRSSLVCSSQASMGHPKNRRISLKTRIYNLELHLAFSALKCYNTMVSWQLPLFYLEPVRDFVFSY